MSSSGTNWLQLVAATAVGAAVSYVVTREIDKRYSSRREYMESLRKNNNTELSENPEERLIAMLEEMDE